MDRVHGYLNDGATSIEDDWDGGWFARGLTVQARKDFAWTEVTGLTVDPAYPYDGSEGPGEDVHVPLRRHRVRRRADHRDTRRERGIHVDR